MHHFGPYKRIVYAKTVIAFGFAAGFALSSKLWLSARLYPLTPIWGGMPYLPSPLDSVLFVILFLLAIFIGISIQPRPYIVGFIFLLLFLALCDQTRWQPWVYLYLFMLVALACYSWKNNDLHGQESVLNICRLIIIATYFYSGLQKLNIRFAVGVSSLLGAIGSHFHILRDLGWVMAFIEISIALGLCTRRYRNIAVVFGGIMHLFILFACTFIFHWNSVVWPWNIAMIFLLILLFWKSDFLFINVVWRNRMWFQKVALVLFGIMPLLSFFGWWDSYLSASLYSANVPMANIFLGETGKRELPLAIQKYVKKVPARGDVLSIQDWSLGELNVPPYPAARAYRAVGAAVCGYSHNSPNITLVVHEKDTLLGKGGLVSDTCLGTLLVNKW
jgi:hypothetical protein